MKHVLAIALFVYTCAQAAPFYSSPSQRPILCATPEAAVRAAELLSAEDKPQDLPSVMMEGRCRIYAAGVRFEILESEGGYSKIKMAGDSVPRYIAGSIEAFHGPFDDYDDKPKRQVGCSPESGGEVRRLEADKDGRLYLKRYMLTSKCVNGEMKSFVKPLN